MLSQSVYSRPLSPKPMMLTTTFRVPLLRSLAHSAAIHTLPKLPYASDVNDNDVVSAYFAYLPISRLLSRTSRPRLWSCATRSTTRPMSKA